MPRHMTANWGDVDVQRFRRIGIGNRRTTRLESMVTAVNHDIIEDYTSNDASPALAFIGYLKAITTGDRQAITDFESTFGKDYMGMGAAIVVITLLGKYAHSPEVYLLSYGNAAYRRAFLPRKRAARNFINDMLDAYESAYLVDEDDTEMVGKFPDLSEEDGTVLAMLSPELHHAGFKRLTYVQGIGYAVADLVFSVSEAADVTVRQILDGLHVAYLESDTSQ